MRLTVEVFGRTLTVSYERDDTEPTGDHLGGSFDLAPVYSGDDETTGRGYDEQMGFRP